MTPAMPLLAAHDALSALERGSAWRWLDVPIAVADAASEPWIVALLALALFAWLEQEVKDVLKAFVPLAVALLAAGGVAVAARAVGATARPVAVGGPGGGSLLLWHAFPAPNVGAVAAFATYALLAYGRRAGAAACAVAVRAWPRGHLARLRAARRPPEAGGAVPERPSA